MRYLFGFALLLPMVVFAQDPLLPEALLNAKTAFVEKVGTVEASFDIDCKERNADAGATDKEQDKYCKSLKKDAKADKQLFDKVSKELQKWGRFTLVQDRSSADIRILLERTSTWRDSIIGYNYMPFSGPLPPIVKPLSWKENRITIIDGRNDVLLYSDQTGRVRKPCFKSQKKDEVKVTGQVFLGRPSLLAWISLPTPA
jgi:hypothetical protein